MRERNKQVNRESNKESNKETVWVVIAAYNEEKRIGAVVSSVLNTGYNHVVVVDDGSKDATNIVAQNAGAEVLRHIINRGQGAALKTGIDFALDQGADIIVTFDADGQHQAEEISALTKPIEAGEVDAVLGSRFLEKKSNVSWHRSLLLKGGAILVWLFYGIHLTDTHNGFRAFSVQAVQKLQLRADRMEHASEILEQIAKQKISYKEVPVTITYSEYSLEKGQRSTAALTILWNMIKSKILR